MPELFVPERPLFRFSGGLPLDGHRELTGGEPARRIPLPGRLYLPLDRHVGLPSRPLVATGEHVLKGQRVAEKQRYVSAVLHAPTSGTIVGTVDVPRPRGGTSPALVLESDGDERWVERSPRPAYRDLSPESVLEIIDQAGIVGLGGAGFPSAVKLAEGRQRRVDMLIVNGVECEPYLTCDRRLILERAAEVVAGAMILKRMVNARQCVLVVEDDTPTAHAALESALTAEADGETHLVSVPARYPSGAERQVIRALTGIELKPEELPIHHGIIVNNVATAAAVFRAVRHDEPLIERLVTVVGDVERPGNLVVPVGTPARDLIEACGRRVTGPLALTFGGPLTGRACEDESAPLDKRTACLVVTARDRVPRPRACIRCGDCIPVCPSRLQPPALLERLRNGDHDVAQDFDLFACIECGLCDAVCPSHIPLMREFRRGKNAIEETDRAEARADAARRHVQERIAHDARRRSLSDARRAGRRPAAAPEDEGDGAAMRQEIEAAVARTREKRRRSPPDRA